MAERSGELNKETTDIEKIDSINGSDASTDNVYLENRPADYYEENAATETSGEDATAETEQLRAQIEETRSQMGETIDAIQEKLSFSNITEQVKDEVSDQITSALKTAKDTVFGATIGKVGNIMNYVDKGLNEIGNTQVGVAARQNPLAISLIGLGLGMLLVNSYSKKRTSYRYDYDYDYSGESDNRSRRGYSSDRTSSAFSSAQSALSSAQSKVGDVAGQAYEGVSSAASRVGSSVTDVAGKVSETVSSTASSAYSQLGNIGSKAKDYAGSAQDQYEHYMEENPLAVGAVALALGAAVGFSIPSTRVENHLMGEAKANLVQKASETAREAMEKVQQVAGEVKQTVQEQAQNQGLTEK